MHRKSIYALFLLLVGTAIYYMTYCTPLYSDDWNYDLVFSLDQKITSLKDVFVSQYYHYLLQNGRTIPHIILQTFDGLLGKGVFNVFNALAFMLLLYLVSVRFGKQCRNYLVTSSLAFALFFFLINGFAESFLWMSGSCNYLWVADLLLAFDLMIRREGYHPRSYLWLFLFGLVCGWTHEGIVIGVSAGYFVYYLFHRDRLNKARCMALAGLYLGTLLVIVSPGSLRRVHVSGQHLDYASSHLEALYYMIDVRALPVLLILMVALLLLRRLRLKAFVMEHLMELTAIATTFVIILYTACIAHRSRFGFEFYAILLIIDLLLTLRGGRETPQCDVSTARISGGTWSGAIDAARDIQPGGDERHRVERKVKPEGDELHRVELKLKPDAMSSTWLDRLAVLSGAATLAAILLLVPKLHENRLESQQMMSQLEKTKTGFVVSPWHETGHWASSYILRLRDSNLRNLYIPEHYQLNSVVFVPQHFLDLIDRGQIDFSGFRTTSRLPFYAKVHHGRTPLYAKVRLQASDPGTMPLLAKPFGSQIGAYGLTHFSAIADTLTYQGTPYVIVWKQKARGITTIHHLDDRIQSIQLIP